MELKVLSRYLEIGGLLLAIFEFLGVGRFIDQFVEWQSKQLSLFVSWYRSTTIIKGLNTEISNINYFFLIFSLISAYNSFMNLAIRKMPITRLYIGVTIGVYIVLYLIFLKVLLPVLEFIIGMYIILISILNTKGLLAIIGILIALTGFILSQVAS